MLVALAGPPAEKAGCTEATTGFAEEEVRPASESTAAHTAQVPKVVTIATGIPMNRNAAEANPRRGVDGARGL